MTNNSNSDCSSAVFGVCPTKGQEVASFFSSILFNFIEMLNTIRSITSDLFLSCSPSITHMSALHCIGFGVSVASELYFFFFQLTL